MFGESKTERRILREIEVLRTELWYGVRQIERLILRVFRPTGYAIIQIVGGQTMPAITGVPVGGSGTFVESPIPSNAVLPQGVVPVWTVDDTNVTLSPSPDGTGVTASVTASDTATSFNLTVTATLPDSTTITGTANVPIIPTPPPVPTAFAISQTS